MFALRPGLSFFLRSLQVPQFHVASVVVSAKKEQRLRCLCSSLISILMTFGSVSLASLCAPNLKVLLVIFCLILACFASSNPRLRLNMSACRHSLVFHTLILRSSEPIEGHGCRGAVRVSRSIARRLVGLFSVRFCGMLNVRLDGIPFGYCKCNHCLVVTRFFFNCQSERRMSVSVPEDLLTSWRSCPRCRSRGASILKHMSKMQCKRKT